MMTIKVNVLWALILHKWVCSIYKGSSSKIKRKKRGIRREEEREKGMGCHRGHLIQTYAKFVIDGIPES